jgi:hypothetical protein
MPEREHIRTLRDLAESARAVGQIDRAEACQLAVDVLLERQGDEIQRALARVAYLEGQVLELLAQLRRHRAAQRWLRGRA